MCLRPSTKQITSNTWLSSAYPSPISVVAVTSISINPDRSVLYHVERVINNEPLKHGVRDLISDYRQRWTPTLTKLSCLVQTQQWTIGVETTVLTVYRVTFRHLRRVGGCGDVSYHNNKCTDMYYNYVQKRSLPGLPHTPCNKFTCVALTILKIERRP